MFGTPINTGLSLTKVLGGLAKTLNIANQVIPLYKEAKPMISNARNILSVLKGINTEEKNGKKGKKEKNGKNENIVSSTKKELTTALSLKVNPPQFFQ